MKIEIVNINKFFKAIFLECVLLCIFVTTTQLVAAISRLDLYLDKQFNERNDNKPAPIVFSPDNKLIAFVTPNNTITLWDLKRQCRLCEFFGHSKRINSIAFSPNGKFLVSGSSDKSVRLWNVQNGNCIYRFSGYRSKVCSVGFNPIGSQIVSMSFDGMVMLLDVFTYKIIRAFFWPL